jgi:hypothetical protein
LKSTEAIRETRCLDKRIEELLAEWDDRHRAKGWATSGMARGRASQIDGGPQGSHVCRSPTASSSRPQEEALARYVSIARSPERTVYGPCDHASKLLRLPQKPSNLSGYLLVVYGMPPGAPDWQLVTVESNHLGGIAGHSPPAAAHARFACWVQRHSPQQLGGDVCID